MLKIVVDDKIPFLKDILEPYAEVVYIPGRKIDRASIYNADALLIRTRTICNENLLRGTSVKFIATATIGFDHIDTAFCDKNNIKWISSPGCNSSSVEQYIASVLFTLAEIHDFQLKDKTIGIIGVGNVGSKIEKLANNLGLNIILNDPPRAAVEGNFKFADLDFLLHNADIVSVHVPLIKGGEFNTEHLIDENNLSKMKNGAILINSSRGEVVETQYLKVAIKENKFLGVVLDVWENEPNIDLELLNIVDIATPHIAGYSADGKANGTSMIVNALSKFFNLRFKKWYPENIPLPLQNEIIIDATDKQIDEITAQAIFHTYKVLDDDDTLRKSPWTFEMHRGNYPLRREFPAFTVDLQNGNNEQLTVLKNLGFNIKQQ